MIRLISLMLWSKDKRGLGEDVEFASGIATDHLRKEIHLLNTGIITTLSQL